MANKNIYVESNFDNIFVVDPNRVFNDQNLPEPRNVNQEDLVMYVNLECELVPRSRLVKGSDGNSGQLTQIAAGTVNYLNPNGNQELTTNWSELQEGIPNQNTLNRELLGIKRIIYKVGLSFVPEVTISLEDVKGRSLFEGGDDSAYSVFFNYPWPVFYLTLKGYYGKATKTRLYLNNFYSSMNQNSGNFELELTFRTEQFSVLRDIQYADLFAVPQMYAKKFNTNQQVNQTNQIGGTNSTVSEVTTYRGYEKIKLVYSNYKNRGLIPQNFPELTLPQLINKLDAFINTTLSSYGQLSFNSFTDYENYRNAVINYNGEIFTLSQSWFSTYMDLKNPFIVTENDVDYEVYTFKADQVENSVTAYSVLEEIVSRNNQILSNNPTFGAEGTKEIKVPVTLSSLIMPTLSISEINIVKTLTVRNNGTPPTQEEIDNFGTELGLIFANANSLLDIEISPFYRLDGDGYFANLSEKIRQDLKSNENEIEESLSEELDIILQSNSGIGFKPTVKNVLAVVMASAEAFLLLLDDVHVKAFDNRNSTFRRNAALAGGNPELSDIKDEPDSPVYPWPQFVVEKTINNNTVYENAYPGDSDYLSITRANDFTIWPEVEFVEEFIKGYLKLDLDPPTKGQTTNLTEVKRNLISGFDTPSSNSSYSNLSMVDFLFEIYERILSISQYQGFPRLVSDVIFKYLPDAESENISNGITNKSFELIEFLKNFKFTPTEFKNYLKSITLNGTTEKWVKLQNGVINTPYLKDEIDNSFKILDVDLPEIKLTLESEGVIESYLNQSATNSMYFTDTYPFVSNTWNQNNLASSISGYEFVTFNNTSNSIVYNSNLKKFANYKTPKTTNKTGDGNFNKPYTNFEVLTNTVVNPIDINSFYTNRTDTQVFTEGNLIYSPNTSLLSDTQTTSILNTPYFINAITQEIENERQGVENPFIVSSYYFLNSLPLATLKEKYKSANELIGNDLDYIAATIKKFGSIHSVPKLWVARLGSVWRRYKTYIETGVDILTNSFTDFDKLDAYDPVSGLYGTQYNISYNSATVNIVLQKTLSSLNGDVDFINVGFYPKLINDFFYLINGVNIYDPYNPTTQIIQDAINSRIQSGEIILLLPDSSKITRTNYTATSSLYLNSWTVLIKNISNNKYVTVPSFGGTVNQAEKECFNSVGLVTPLIGNSSLYNGSARLLWGAPNYGYFNTSTITIPRPDQYLKVIDTQTQLQSSFDFVSDSTYSNIEELFSVFQKEELDLMEQEFLNFSKSRFDVTNNFTLHQQINDLLQYDYKVLGTNDNDVVIKIQNDQINNFVSMMKGLLSENFIMVKGNPTNFNPQSFSSLSSNPLNFSQVETDYNSGTPNALPILGNTITLSVSLSNYPEEWKTLKTYVGFSTISELVYSDSGSYITDFFPVMNIGFTVDNIIYYSSLIKVFATQKLLDNTLTKDSFVGLLDSFFVDIESFQDNLFTQTLQTLQNKLPNTVKVENDLNDSPLKSYLTKVELYDLFKTVNDKWVAGNNYSSQTLLEDVLLLDRANRNISDQILVNVTELNKTFKNSSKKIQVYEIIENIVRENGFIISYNPIYINYYNSITPQLNSQNNEDPEELFADKLFGTFDSVDFQETKPKMVCVYQQKPSEQLNNRNINNGYNSDSFDLTKTISNPMIENQFGKTDWALSNKTVGFTVDFGLQNQNVFSTIDVSQENGEATSESLDAQFKLATSSSGSRTNTQSVSLYNVFKTRQYKARISCLGNMMIQPTNYFVLRNVPMFSGTFYITEVTHTIGIGEFRTEFTGQRQKVSTLPYVNPILMTVKRQLIADAKNNYVNKLSRSSNVTSTVTNVNQQQTNTTQTLIQKKKPAEVQICEPSQSYSTYASTTPVETNFTITDIVTKINGIVDDANSKKIIFTLIMSFTYDAASVQVKTWNNNLILTRLDGGIWGGSLSALFENEFICLEDENLKTGTYSVFSTPEKSLEFINKKFVPVYINSVTNFTDVNEFATQFVKQLINDTGTTSNYYDLYKINNQASITALEDNVKIYFNLASANGI
jgi:hypothetical protein